MKKTAFLNPFYYLSQGRVRLYAVRSLFKERSYLYGPSLYPEEKQKTRIRIIFEQLFYAIKYGVADDRYFLNGMDRRESPYKGDILDNAKFKKIRNGLNSNPLPGQDHNYLMILRDKFYFNQLLSKLDYPIPVLRLLIDGERFCNLETKEWKSLDGILDLTIDGCMKDINGIQGRRVNLFKVYQQRIWIGGKEVDFDFFKAYCLFGKLLVEDKIIQHAALNRFNNTSVNSLRIVTVCNKENIEIFAAFIRIGKVGSFTDNVAQGGSLVDVNLETGRLEPRGWIRYPEKIVNKHPDTTIEFKDFEIPFYKEAIEMSKALHRFFYHIHSIGWDIAITENGPCFIEGNDNWGLPFQGLTRGLKADFERLFIRH